MIQSVKTIEFIEKVKHKGKHILDDGSFKYDYSLVDYLNNATKVIIICHIHGEFYQTPNCHLAGNGCAECRNGSNDKFIKKSINKHGNKFDYSLVEYTSYDEKVKIICKIHGVFEQSPTNHLRSGCVKCHHDTKRLTNELFIKKASEKHGDKYDYSKVDYKEYRIPVLIICKTHGEFYQKPTDHLNSIGCLQCAMIVKNNRIGYQESVFNIDASLLFIEKSIKIHGELYDYSKVVYINTRTKVDIICNKHGVFKQRPDQHLYGQGCMECTRMTTEEFIEKATNVHSNKYDYSLVEYKKSNSKVNIQCKKHGIFSQTPNNHLRGKGCSNCSTYSFESKGEQKIRIYLESNSIEYIQEYKFDDLCLERPLRFDFYLPNNQICIEFDGQHHYKPIDFYGGISQLKLIQDRDFLKRQYCESNKIILLRIPYYDFDNIDSILNSLFGLNRNR